MNIYNPKIRISDKILKSIDTWDEFNIKDLVNSINWSEQETKLLPLWLDAADKYLIEKKYTETCQIVTFGKDDKANIRKITELGYNIKNQGGEILIQLREDTEAIRKEKDQKEKAENEKSKKDSEEKIRLLDEQLKTQQIKLNDWSYKGRYIIISVSILTLIVAILTYFQKIEEYEGKVKNLEKEIKTKDSLLQKANPS